ncbi:MAG: hypothetical protein R2764_13545 [Bacteroidales bacterium]
MKKAFIIFVVVFWVIPGLMSQSVLDSALHQRNRIYSDFYEFQQGMEERTWINMVNITTKANEVIKADNTIINYHLYNLLKENENQLDKIGQLDAEILLLKKEAQMQKLILEERRFLFNLLLIIIATVSILFLIILILYINRQIRYQGLKAEIHHLYSHKDNESNQYHDNQKLFDLKDEIELLKKEKQSLNSKVNSLTEDLNKKQQELETEISSKKEVEEHIRKLIRQIKAYQ